MRSNGRHVRWRGPSATHLHGSVPLHPIARHSSLTAHNAFLMTVLGIESSCDETAAAVVRHGDDVLSSVVYSQVPLHQPYGGVVPEIASRSHIEKIRGIVARALAKAFPGDSAPWARVDAIAATCGPGLAASLLVGWTAAKGLALALGKPLLPINHMHAHLWSVRLGHPELREANLFPQLGLAVSGGHTCFVDCPGPNRFCLIGQTIDDAAGEAFDKAAKRLGLGYPGGPAIDREAKRWRAREAKGAGACSATPAGSAAPCVQATPSVIPSMGSNPSSLSPSIPLIRFPQGKVAHDHPLPEGLRPELCVSFSGLKTALLTHLQKHPPQGEDDVAHLCASYQEAIVDALARRVDLTLSDGNYRSLAIGGGVSLNGRLREAFQAVAERHRVRLLVAEACYCGDNAAMVAGLASVGGIALRRLPGARH